MVKRISCRVVNSVPLGNGDGRSRPVNRSRNEHPKSCNTAGSCSNGSGTSGAYPNQSVPAIGRVNTDLLGQTLDCYA
jgi:hypothetical protein